MDLIEIVIAVLQHYKVPDRGLVHPLTTPVVDVERMGIQRLREHHWIPRDHLTFGQKLGHGEFGGTSLRGIRFTD